LIYNSSFVVTTFVNKL